MPETIKTFKEYEADAKEIYDRVLAIMKWGRGNKTDGDEQYDIDYRAQCVNDMRSAANKAEAGRSPGIRKNSYEHLKTYADYAQMFGCGNCEEFSSLTFELLKQKNVMPLDWMQQGGFLYGLMGSLGNHAFVIIGRNKSTVETDISTWNEQVVWCDPYEKEIGGLDKIKERFSGKVLMHRVRFDSGGIL